MLLHVHNNGWGITPLELAQLALLLAGAAWMISLFLL